MTCMNERLPVDKECLVCSRPVPNWLNTNNLCISCRRTFKSGEDRKVNNCGHQFHADCYKKETAINCPLCCSRLDRYFDYNNECIYCNEKYSVSDKFKKTLSCGHIFHFRCINQYLPIEKQCRICETRHSNWVNTNDICVADGCGRRFGSEDGTLTNTCGHQFHKRCYYKHKQVHKKCFVCKAVLKNIGCDDDVCSYCNRRFDSSDKTKSTLRCGHNFHLQCLNENMPEDRACRVCDEQYPNWFNTNNICVANGCRQHIPTDETSVVNDCGHQFHERCFYRHRRIYKCCSFCNVPLGNMPYCDESCNYCGEHYNHSNKPQHKLKCGHVFHLWCLNENMPKEMQCRCCDKEYTTWTNANKVCMNSRCKKKFRSNDKITVNDCGHKFHDKCFFMLRCAKRNCDICQVPLGDISDYSDESCHYCKEKYDDSHKVKKVLRCEHTFHLECLNEYMPQEKMCRVCMERYPNWKNTNNMCVAHGCWRPISLNERRKTNACGHDFHEKCFFSNRASYRYCPFCHQETDKISYSEEVCTYCDERYDTSDHIKQSLRCGHKFHMKCLNEKMPVERECRICEEAYRFWINTNDLCVSHLCRKRITPSQRRKVSQCGHKFHDYCYYSQAIKLTHCPICNEPIGRPLYSENWCVYCSEGYREDRVKQALSCGHVFHRWCVNQHLPLEKKCRICDCAHPDWIDTNNICVALSCRKRFRLGELKLTDTCGHEFHESCFKVDRKFKECFYCPEFVKSSIDFEEFCYFCRERFNKNNDTYRIRCGHAFHTKCLQASLSTEQQCDPCKTGSTNIKKKMCAKVSCQKKFVPNDKRLTTLCHHEYHKDCFDLNMSFSYFCPICQQTTDETIDNDLICCWCTKSLKNSFDSVRKLDCDHYFHMKCLIEVMPSFKKCPLCDTQCNASTGVNEMCLSIAERLATMIKHKSFGCNNLLSDSQSCRFCVKNTEDQDPNIFCRYCGEMMKNSSKVLYRLECGHKFHPSCVNFFMPLDKKCVVCSYPVEGWINANSTCVICWEDIHHHQESMVNECEHKMHKSCYEPKKHLYLNCPVCDHKIADAVDHEKFCSYCWKEFDNTPEMKKKRTTCGHTFHLRCLNEHLSTEAKCVVCKYDIPGWVNANDMCVGCKFHLSETDEKQIGICGHGMHKYCYAALKSKRCPLCRGRMEITNSTDMLCSICLDDFSGGTQSTVTKCKHKYHLLCIRRWQQSHDHCPVCRQSM